MAASVGDIYRDADQTDLIARQLDRTPNDGIGILDREEPVKGREKSLETARRDGVRRLLANDGRAESAPRTQPVETPNCAHAVTAKRRQSSIFCITCQVAVSWQRVQLGP